MSPNGSAATFWALRKSSIHSSLVRSRTRSSMPLAQLLAIRLGKLARRAVEALLKVDVLEADRRDESVEEVVDEVGRLDPRAVTGHHGLVVDRRLRAVGAELVTRHLRREGPLQLRADQAVHVVAHQALQQTGLDQLAAPALVAHQQRPEDARQR